MTEAKFAGRCAVCGTKYGIGTHLAKYGTAWGHEACVAAEKNKGLVESGEAFRGQKPSNYRRNQKRQ